MLDLLALVSCLFKPLLTDLLWEILSSALTDNHFTSERECVSSVDGSVDQLFFGQAFISGPVTFGQLFTAGNVGVEDPWTLADSGQLLVLLCPCM